MHIIVSCLPRYPNVLIFALCYHQKILNRSPERQSPERQNRSPVRQSRRFSFGRHGAFVSCCIDHTLLLMLRHPTQQQSPPLTNCVYLSIRI